jgi:hypothetical protein
MQFGFDVKADVPLDARAPPLAAALGPLSPGRRETKPSLLSMALSDLPLAGSLSFAAPFDLYGSASPSLSFLHAQVRCGCLQGQTCFFPEPSSPQYPSAVCLPASSRCSLLGLDRRQARAHSPCGY